MTIRTKKERRLDKLINAEPTNDYEKWVKAQAKVKRAISVKKRPVAPVKPPHMTQRGKIITDPVEATIAVALREAWIEYVTEEDERSKNLDFYLPAYNIHIECKRMFTPRITEQMQRVDEVIVIQGLHAARMFAMFVRAMRHDLAKPHLAYPFETMEPVDLSELSYWKELEYETAREREYWQRRARIAEAEAMTYHHSEDARAL